MGLIVTRRQPGIGFVDQRNPIASGITLLMGDAVAGDAVRKTPLAIVGAPPPRIVDPIGTRYALDGSTQYFLDANPAPQNFSAITAFAWFNWSGATSSSNPNGNAQLVSKDASGARSFAFDLSAEAAPNAYLRFYLNGSSNGFAKSAAAVISPNTEYLVAVMYDPATGQAASLYVNGVQIAQSNPVAFSGNAIPNTTAPISIGGRPNVDGPTYFGGYIRLAAVWRRALSAKQVADLTANPWQLFAPPQRVRFASAAAGSAATLAATDGADTLSSAATSTAVGNLAATDGADTSASSATSSAVASLASTDGLDVLVATGSATTSATLATTDGADVLAGSASSTASATLALTDGADTLAATGSTSSGASLAVTDGADLLSATAVVTTIGSLVSTDSNDYLTAVASGGITYATVAVTDAADTLVAYGLGGSNPYVVGINLGAIAVTLDGRVLAVNDGSIGVLPNGQTVPLIR